MCDMRVYVTLAQAAVAGGGSGSDAPAGRI